MNNTEKKIDWIFEAMRFQLENFGTNNESWKTDLLNNADRIIANIETEKEKPTMESEIKEALSD